MFNTGVAADQVIMMNDEGRYVMFFREYDRMFGFLPDRRVVKTASYTNDSIYENWIQLNVLLDFLTSFCALARDDNSSLKLRL